MKILRINSLEKEWCDKDYVLLHASFQILVDFIELEKSDKIIDWSFDSKHRKVWAQIRNLYKLTSGCICGHKRHPEQRA